MMMAASPNSDAKSRPSSSKALNIARTAKLELSRGSKEGVAHAITMLEELSVDPAFRRLQIDERLSVYTMLTNAYLSAGKFQMQESLLSQLLKDQTFKPYWIRLKANLGECYLAQENLQLASKIMKELLRTPKRRLSSDDADSVAALHKKIERHTELRLKTAQRLYSQKDYQKAATIYEYLYKAALARSFPKTYSKTHFKAFLDSLSVRLATCYFMQNALAASLEVFDLYDPKNTSSYALKGYAEKKLGNFTNALNNFEKINTPSEKILWESCLCAYKAKTPEKALELSDRFLHKYPKSPHAADILFEKAMLFWQLNDYENAYYTFSFLKANHTHFIRLDATLFFMASMLQNTDPEKHALYLELITDFPQSPYAPESYYRMFPEEMYLSGDIQALRHLKKMPKAYSSSPFGVLATFCVARFEREECPQSSLSTTQIKMLTETTSALTEAIAKAKALQESMPPKMQALFTLHILNAEYEKAECHFTLANFYDVLTTCDSIKQAISQVSHEKKPHLLWHKAAFLKSRALLLQGNESQAREELTNLLEYSANTGFEKSEPLVLALIELADMRAREEDYDVAFLMLNKALTLRTESTNEELLLEILIAKSQLHRKIGELDKAMMLLSSVINEESASSLRIQAMFLRAEVYEHKGRRDLAFRQLQTTAKKGGEWGARAAKKLEEKYGYE